MIISLNWLKEYVDISIPAEDLAHRLTMAGLEIEGQENTADGDILFEVNVTPNRPDCLSIFGLAREVSAITGSPLRRPVIELREEGEAASSLAGVRIDDSLCCPRYAARVVRGVRVGESPEWLKRRLAAVGQRPVNNVVDITNYVLFETGHPTHAFDLARLFGPSIIVRRGSPGERIITLDEKEHEVIDDTLLICDGAGTPIALAGIMGGLGSSVTEQATDILIESAYFDPSIVRRTARRLGVKTESSYRFERGVDVEGLVYSLDRVAMLIAQVAGGMVATGRIDLYPAPIAEVEINLRPERVNRLLGLDLPAERMEDILSRLSFDISRVEGDGFRVTPPTFRKDVEAEIDLVEEIARLHGYDNIPVTLHEGQPSTTRAIHNHDITQDLRNLLAASGLSEAVNFSFMNPAHLDRFDISPDNPLRRTVAIANPLTEEQGVMRTFLIPSLVENLRWNLNRGVQNVRIFEISRVFAAVNSPLPEERPHLACLIHGMRHAPHWSQKPGPLTFFDIKGVVEGLLESLHVRNIQWKKEGQPFLHPGMSATLYIDDAPAGYVGALHPDVAEAMEVEGPVFVAELDVSVLACAVVSPVYRALPRYPAAERDMAILVDDAVSADEVLAVIRGAGTELMEAVTIFDIYCGDPVPAGKKSMAFSIRYQSPERTLSDEEVKRAHAAIVEKVNMALGAQLRQ